MVPWYQRSWEPQKEVDHPDYNVSIEVVNESPTYMGVLEAGPAARSLTLKAGCDKEKSYLSAICLHTQFFWKS